MCGGIFGWLRDGILVFRHIACCLGCFLGRYLGFLYILKPFLSVQASFRQSLVQFVEGFLLALCATSETFILAHRLGKGVVCHLHAALTALVQPGLHLLQTAFCLFIEHGKVLFRVLGIVCFRIATAFTVDVLHGRIVLDLAV